MSSLILYLLESSAVLAFFYVLYILVLKRETFFSFNRFFLIGILVFSLLSPFLKFDFIPSNVVAVEQPIEEISKIRLSYYEAIADWEIENLSSTESLELSGENTSVFYSGIEWAKIIQTILFIIYLVGIVACLSRTIWTLRGIWKMTRIYPNDIIDGVKVIKIPSPIAPFSFLNYVFVPNSLNNPPDFDQIMAHEKIHIEQRHSIDLIFVQLLAAFLWFNPLIWQLIKSLKTTHEYIADKKIINAGYSLVEYQSLLLRQLISNNSFGLVHNFNLSFIKKRITMMEIKKSGWEGRAKVAMVLCAVVLFSLFIVQCNAVIDEPIKIKKEIKQIKKDTHSGL
jgi:beta-lactamase regulating signal transducer with metallopeptidase domain